MRFRLFLLAGAIAISSGPFSLSSPGAAPVQSASVSSDLQTSAATTTYGVLGARKDGIARRSKLPCMVKRGEVVWIDVLDIAKWLQYPKVAEGFAG